MKDHITDYATEAFRYYARRGEPTYEELRESIRKRAFNETVKEMCGVSGNIAKPTEYQVMRMEEAEQENEAELLDILAVSNTFERIRELRNGREIEQAVRAVYMTDLKRDWKERNFITDKVNAESIELHACERSIYRWLAKARRIFAEERKLRIF